MSLTGKGFIIWKVQNCEYGNVQAIIHKAQSAGLTHVLIKVADGPQPYNASYLPGLVAGLKSAGIAVWGWQYVYGEKPLDEAAVALNVAGPLHLDGYVVNAEREYEGKFGQAGAYMERLAAGLKGVPLALTSFRAPEYHPTFPWTEFLSHCQVNMPQVFWTGGQDPARLLQQTIEQFKHIYPVVPLVPTGPTYEAGSWRPTVAQIHGFLAAARQMALDGVNFWNWDYAGGPHGGDLWQAIAGFDWSGQDGVTSDPVSRLFDALNRSDVEAIVRLYEPEGVLVTKQHTLKGTHALRDYYTNFLRAFPQGRFEVEKRESANNVEHVTWRGLAAAQSHTIRDGQDTIGVRDGRIQYHTSLYQVS